jgi:hypothetical protein
MEKVNVEVNYCTVDFEVSGYYIKSNSYDNTKSCLDDAEITIQGVDLWEILSTKQWNDIIDLAIQEIES